MRFLFYYKAFGLILLMIIAWISVSDFKKLNNNSGKQDRTGYPLELDSLYTITSQENPKGQSTASSSMNTSTPLPSVIAHHSTAAEPTALITSPPSSSAPTLESDQASLAALPLLPLAASPKPGLKPISIPVLNYHSVTIDPGNIVTISPAKFTRQMEYLAQQGFQPLTLTQFFAILENRQPAPPKPILLTFDDGYADNYHTVMPILKQFGFPATLFMSPGIIGDGWFINWEQAAEMLRSGWDIQPHGMTHPHLPRLTKNEQIAEIVTARKLIEEHLGIKADVFCYPYGEYNQNTLTILRENGFKYAFTIQQGRTDATQEPFKLKRIFVNGEETLETWAKRILPL